MIAHGGYLSLPQFVPPFLVLPQLPHKPQPLRIQPFRILQPFHVRQPLCVPLSLLPLLSLTVLWPPLWLLPLLSLPPPEPPLSLLSLLSLFGLGQNDAAEVI